ncbi:MAG: MBL fold metallo-hydrolase [Acidobacteriota bacterium]
MKLGEIELHIIQDGSFGLDGGAMFGIVPRPLWSRTKVPDTANRIRLSLNCVLVRTADRTILVEAGLGRSLPPGFGEHLACEEVGRLEERLAELDVGAADVDVLILSHLHFDHAGGATWLAEDGRWHPTFPNAEVWVQRGEWENACRPNERTRAAYRPESLRPLEAEGRVRFLDGPVTVAPGVRLEVLGGHTPHMMGVWVEAAGATVFFASDLVPTTAHLRYPYIAAYDLDPLTTLETKQRLLPVAAREGWWWIFAHDERPMARLEEDEKGHIRPCEEAR